MPEFYWTHMYLVAVHGQLGNEGESQAAINKVSELRPGFWEKPRAPFRKWNTPDRDLDVFLEGFRKAGLNIPDEARN